MSEKNAPKKAIRWTDEKVRALKLPEGKKEYRAVVDVGLYIFLRAKADGSVSKQWQYRAQVHGTRRWLSLGAYPGVGLADARRELLSHQSVQTAAKKGEADHPALVARTARRKSSKEPTVTEVFEDMLADKRLGSPRTGGKPLRDRTLKILQDNFDGDIKARAGEVKISKTSQELIQSCIDAPRKRGAPGQAAQVYKTWRALVNHAKKRGLLTGRDPMDGIENPKPYRPAAVVAATDAELKTLYKVMESASISGSTRLAFELQLLTGARPDEAVGAPLAEFDLPNRLWRLPADRVKTHEAIDIYLSDEALAVIEKAKSLPRLEGNVYLFPGRGLGPQGRAAASRALARMAERLQELGCRPFKPHDLRRTFRTLLSRLGVAPHIAERCINHKEETMQRVYDGYDYFPEMKAAWEKAGAHIAALKSGGAEVVPISKARA